jgi:hypothetical protein
VIGYCTNQVINQEHMKSRGSSETGFRMEYVMGLILINGIKRGIYDIQRV